MPSVRRGLLRNADFLKLWTGQTISVLGAQVTILAVPIVAAVALQVSPFEFGLLTTIEFVPFVFLSLPAGAWVDRLRRRPILIAADVGRAISLLSIPVAFAFNALTIWQLYVVVFVNGSLTVFFDVAAQSYLPSILGREQLVDGNAKLELSRTTSQRLGPGIAGVLIAVVGAPFAVIADAASYLGSALFLSLIRRPEALPVAAAEPIERSIRREVAEGLRFVAAHRWLRVLAISGAISQLFGNIVDSILILHLVTERGFEAPQIGFAFTIGSVGVISGALLARRVSAVLGIGPTLLLATVGESVSWLPIPIAPDGWLFAAVTLTITALGFFASFWTINAVSLRQTVTPAPLLGRVTATMRFVTWGLIPAGALLGGVLGTLVGLHNAIWIGAIGHVLVFVPLALSPISRIRSMPAQAEAPARAS